jgi:GH24 family phage-related lysozyme (muramidase)
VETNRRGTLLILSYEQLRLRPYKDAVGKLTVGWGHLVLASEMEALNRELTRTEANDLFLRDLEEKEAGVSSLLPVKLRLTSNQFSALVCFTFNVGISAFSGSTMYRPFGRATSPPCRRSLGGGRRGRSEGSRRSCAASSSDGRPRPRCGAWWTKVERAAPPGQ